jgi:hypothetical protein
MRSAVAPTKLIHAAIVMRGGVGHAVSDLPPDVRHDSGKHRRAEAAGAAAKPQPTASIRR